jgi:hypothetical protein
MAFKRKIRDFLTDHLDKAVGSDTSCLYLYKSSRKTRTIEIIKMNLHHLRSVTA